MFCFGQKKKDVMVKTLVMKVFCRAKQAPFSRLLCPSHYHDQFQTTGRQSMIWVILTVMEKVTKSIFKQYKPCVFGLKCCLVLGAT